MSETLATYDNRPTLKLAELSIRPTIGLQRLPRDIERQATTSDANKLGNLRWLSIPGGDQSRRREHVGPGFIKIALI